MLRCIYPKSIDIKSPMFCDKYKLDWDSYGVENSNDLTDKDCYVNQNSTRRLLMNQPIHRFIQQSEN